MVGRMRLTSLSRSIAGKRALVTGAASGMGRATAHLFADEGARVAVVDLRQDRVDAVVGEITEAHGADAAIGVVTDVADSAAAPRLVDTVVAGSAASTSSSTTPASALPTFSEQARTTSSPTGSARWPSTSPPTPTSSASPCPTSRRAEGRVVNIASTEAIVTTAGMVAYTATKAASSG